MLRFSSLVLLLASIYAADALGGGAPRGACDTLSPNHQSNTPQITEVPYNIDLDQFNDGTGTFQYVPGQTYTLTLQGNNGETFQGFFVQSRLVADDTTRVGVFAVDALNTRLSSCLVNTDGITHSNENSRTSVTMDWTAPDVGTGPVRFGFAVAQSFSTFWANERSAALQEGPAPPEPSEEITVETPTTPGETPTTPGETPTTPGETPTTPGETPTTPGETMPPGDDGMNGDDGMTGDDNMAEDDGMTGDDNMAEDDNMTGSTAVLVISTLTLLLSTVGAVLLL